MPVSLSSPTLCIDLWLGRTLHIKRVQGPVDAQVLVAGFMAVERFGLKGRGCFVAWRSTRCLSCYRGAMITSEVQCLLQRKGAELRGIHFIVERDRGRDETEAETETKRSARGMQSAEGERKSLRRA